MTKAALLSTCGDVFITELMLKLWKERWYNEIDHLYINFNNHCRVPKEVVGEFLAKIADEPKITFLYHPTGIGNGPPQVELLKLCNEDLILLLEDDFFIFTPGIVDKYFKKIESGETDLLGSPRYTYGEVAEAAQKKYNLDYSGYGDKGFGWWPTGFYCKREDLLKTDLDFGSKKYPAGEYFKELDYIFKEDNYTDTFTWTSLQLRYLGLRSTEIPQFHADPYEVQNKEAGDMNWKDGEPTYIHGGSLSTSWGGYLGTATPDLSNENAVREIETRIAFWTIAVAITGEDYGTFAVDYATGIENLINNSPEFDRKRINQKKDVYRDLMRI